MLLNDQEVKLYQKWWTL